MNEYLVQTTRCTFKIKLKYFFPFQLHNIFYLLVCFKYNYLNKLYDYFIVDEIIFSAHIICYDVLFACQII